MPGGGIDAAQRINAELPETKLAMLSGSAGRDRVRDAIRAGADGFLLRSTAPDRLTAALNGLIKGEAALPRALTGRLVQDLRDVERQLERSTNGHPPSPIAAAQLSRGRREAAARGAAAAHRAAVARRAAEARRSEHAVRADRARRANGPPRADGPRRASGMRGADGPGRAERARTTRYAWRAGEIRRSVTDLPLSVAISSRVLYLPRLVRHFQRRLRSGMPIALAWASARARMVDYKLPIEPSAMVAGPGLSSPAS
jgi:CheY-like chemotaxis protein